MAESTEQTAPTNISAKIYNPDNTVREIIYSTTGEKRTDADFDKAYTEKLKTGIDPKGYVILKPESLSSYFRSGFEKVNQPVQEGLRTIGRTVGGDLAPTGFAALGEKLGLFGKGSAQAVQQGGEQAGESLLGGVGEQFNTPAKLGTTVGMALAAKAAAPTSFTSGTGLVTLAKNPFFWNAVKAGVLGGAGSATARGMTGENPVSIGTAKDAGVAALSQGFAGLMDYALTKFLPNKAEKVATSIMQEVKDQYPHLANDKRLMEYAFAKDNRSAIKNFTQRYTDALAESADDIAKDLVSNTVKEVNFYAPRSLSVGQQATLRSKARTLAEHGRDMLTYIDDPEKLAKAQAGMQEAQDGIIDYLSQQLVGMGAKKNTATGNLANTKENAKMIGALVDNIQKVQTELQRFNEGAKVLAALKRSGADKEFDAVAFNNAIAGKYMEQPGSLLERVGQKLGMGATLTPGATPQPPGLMQDVLSAVQGHVPVLRHLPSMNGPKAIPATLPWQKSSTLSPPQSFGTQIGADLAGDEAIKAFSK